MGVKSGRRAGFLIAIFASASLLGCPSPTGPSDPSPAAPDAFKVAVAALTLTSQSDDLAAGISGALELPSVLDGFSDAHISWSSEPNGYIDTDTGQVTRPASGLADVTVNLTATVSLDGRSETKSFVVTVLALPPVLTVFAFADPAVNATIDEAERTVTAIVPDGTDLTRLVAVFTVSGAETAVKVGESVQESGATPNDFTNAVEYTLVANDRAESFFVTVSISDSDYRYALLGDGTVGLTGLSKLWEETVPRKTELQIPAAIDGYAVSAIAVGAFSDQTDLISVSLPSSILTIDDSAFSACSGLTSVSLPSTLQTIGDSAFSGCSGLTSLVLPSSILTIGDSAFSGCSGLASVSLPSALQTISVSAFNGCSSLTSLVLPSSILTIGDSAFSGCSALASSRLEADTPPAAGTGLFQDCGILAEIIVPFESLSAYKAADAWSSYADVIVPYTGSVLVEIE